MWHHKRDREFAAKRKLKQKPYDICSVITNINVLVLLLKFSVWPFRLS